jgi:hypothetical protein
MGWAGNWGKEELGMLGPGWEEFLTFAMNGRERK